MEKDKYGLDKLRAGISINRAIEVSLGACNKYDTLFITDRWVQPRLDRLRTLLSEPLTEEQAEALRDAVMRRGLLDDVIEWLSGTTGSWPTFNRGKKWLASETQKRALAETDAELDRLKKLAVAEEMELKKRGIVRWQALRDNLELQEKYPADGAAERYGSKARSCPGCGASPDMLRWFWYTTPPITWAMKMGRAGWMTCCKRCDLQIDFFIAMMN